MQKEQKMVLLGTITAAHGLRGEVKIRSYTENPVAIAAYQPLLDKNGEREFSLEIVGHVKDQLIARVDGITKREEAENLRGTELYISRDRLPAPETEGSYFIEDLVGLRVQLSSGEAYGQIRAVHNFGAGDILEIAVPDKKMGELYAFSQSNFPTVDVKAGFLVFNPPEAVKDGPQQD